MKIQRLFQQLGSIIGRSMYTLFRRPGSLKRGGNILKWVFPRILTEWRYESSGSDEITFVANVADIPVQRVKDTYNLCSTFLSPLILEKKRILYTLVRMVQPETVIETGVGGSTVAILQALQDNNQGKLISIDLPDSGNVLADGTKYYSNPAVERASVPNHLYERWQLMTGDAKAILPELLEKSNPIDIFFHDSLHTEEHMMFEYQTAWPYISPKGVLLSHDISVSFFNFSRLTGRRFYCTDEGGNRYGAIIK